MSYDITFCEGAGCHRRNKMYQVYKADKREDKPRFIMVYRGEVKKCLMFWGNVARKDCQTAVEH